MEEVERVLSGCRLSLWHTKSSKRGCVKCVKIEKREGGCIEGAYVRTGERVLWVRERRCEVIVWGEEKV